MTSKNRPRCETAGTIFLFQHDVWKAFPTIVIKLMRTYDIYKGTGRPHEAKDVESGVCRHEGAS
jgi:hypothetical protein